MYSISEFAGLLVKQAREEKQWDQQYNRADLSFNPPFHCVCTAQFVHSSKLRNGDGLLGNR